MNSKPNIVNIINTNSNPVSNILSCVLLSLIYIQPLDTTNFIIRYFYFYVSVCTITNVVLSYVLLSSFYPQSYVVAMLVTSTYSFLHIMCLLIVCCVIYYYFKSSIGCMYRFVMYHFRIYTCSNIVSLEKTKTSCNVTFKQTHINRESYVSPRYVAFQKHNAAINHCSNNIYNHCMVLSCMVFSILINLIKSNVDKVGTKSSDVISRVQYFGLDILDIIGKLISKLMKVLVRTITNAIVKIVETITELIISLINVPTFIYNFLRYRLDVLLDSMLHYIKCQRTGSEGRVLMTIDTLSKTTFLENHSKAHKSINFIITNYLTCLMYTILCNLRNVVHNVVYKNQCFCKDFFHKWIPVMYNYRNSNFVVFYYYNNPKNCPIQSLTSHFAKMLFNTKRSCLSYIRQLFLSFANVVNYCGRFMKCNVKNAMYDVKYAMYNDKCTTTNVKYAYITPKVQCSFINYTYNRVVTKAEIKCSLSNPFY
jgi:hypothetical protein